MKHWKRNWWGIGDTAMSWLVTGERSERALLLPTCLSQTSYQSKIPPVSLNNQKQIFFPNLHLCGCSLRYLIGWMNWPCGHPPRLFLRHEFVSWDRLCVLLNLGPTLPPWQKPTIAQTLLGVFSFLQNKKWLMPGLQWRNNGGSLLDQSNEWTDYQGEWGHVMPKYGPHVWTFSFKMRSNHIRTRQSASSVLLFLYFHMNLHSSSSRFRCLRHLSRHYICYISTSFNNLRLLS